MKVKIEKYVPMGINYKQEIKWISGGLGISLLYSFSFLLRLSGECNELFVGIGEARVLKDGAIMTDFAEILGRSLMGFFAVALCMLAILAYHYIYHYQGSKSIYLMKRLPSRFELLKRCITLPAVSVAAALAMAVLLLLLYFAIYLWVTPESCLTPHQWQKIWMGV